MSQPGILRSGCRLAQSQSSHASSFVQHCRRALSTTAILRPTQLAAATAQQARPIPEFLLPSRGYNVSRGRFDGLNLTAARARCAFSTSAARREAKVVLNPRNDEEGNPMWVDISERAAERLRQITDPSSSSHSTTLEENPYHHLRITVSSGGCHGFQYLMSLEPSSKIDPEEDTIFQAENTESGSGGGEAKVVMDEPSLELLQGSTVDYTMELIGSQFKIVNNPRATSNCGCGTSFDVA